MLRKPPGVFQSTDERSAAELEQVGDQADAVS